MRAIQIATDLDGAHAEVSAMLQGLESKPEISSHMVDGRGHWGAYEQTQRLQNAERQAELDQAARAQRIIDNNDELDAIRIRYWGRFFPVGD